ncbi:MAG: 3-isopropylmalate dehydrogenase [Chloroflexi bacterium]|nr:3-isopropylmalate dehydrogenase [Chloroflexota bacterium]|tara:strand:- start:28 stop:1119 length:1092 start_codon:yes stop_codon:yes gene_type:complete
MKFNITVLDGDGIGPEVTREAINVMETIGEKYNHQFIFTHELIGGISIDQKGTALPQESIISSKKSDAVLLGAVGGPKWDNPSAPVRPEDGLLAIRKELGLFANIRPVSVFPDLTYSSTLKSETLNGVDFVVIRELTGGLYFGKPKRRWKNTRGRQAVDTMRYSEKEIRRVLKVGFEMARIRNKRLTSVDKANVLETSRLWREIAIEMSNEYTDVAVDHMLVDTASMQLVRNPSQFDVIVTENTFGDILTDEASVLTGSMGMLPSASLAQVPMEGTKTMGLYEPIHGSAPDIAGKGIANPLACILSIALLFRYSLRLNEEAAAIENAVQKAINEGYRCADIARDGDNVISTKEMGALISSLLK